MGGSVAGGKRVAALMLAKDPDYYRKLGRKGGKISRGGGFKKGSEHTRLAGQKGGRTKWERHGEQMRADFIERRKTFNR